MALKPFNLPVLKEGVYWTSLIESTQIRFLTKLKNLSTVKSEKMFRFIYLRFDDFVNYYQSKLNTIKDDF